MGRMKGFLGEACSEAIANSLQVNEIVTFTELFNRVRKKGTWKDDAIWQHLIGLAVNLPPARRHWKNAKPFLFLHEDGRYELFNPNRHPPTRE